MKENLQLSKSKTLRGLVCPISLWHEIYNSEEWQKEEDISYKVYSSIQIKEIQALARKKFPKGEFAENLISLKNLKEVNFPIYNLNLSFENFHTQIDILVPTHLGWEIYIVKPIAKLKKEIFLEMAYHSFIAKESGWKISATKILFINSNYFFEKEIDLEEYFKVEDVTEKILPIQANLKKQLLNLKTYLHKTPTEVKEIPKCNTPKTCRNPKLCWKELPNLSVFELRESGAILEFLLEKKIHTWTQIPEDLELSFSQKVQIQCSIHQKPHIDKKMISEFLEKIQYPLYFLDFETINPPLPVYPQTKPFQHIPFLYYLFCKHSTHSSLEEFYFIDDFQSDPRKKILDKLSKEISKGSIICYNDLIEKRCLKEAVEIYPEYKEWYETIKDQFIDISQPFREFWYYHPAQKGSASLKAVLTPLTGLSYNNLDIKDGGTANFEFLKLKLNPTFTPIQEETLEKLKFYCKMDAFAINKILEKLKELDSSVEFLLVEKN